MLNKHEQAMISGIFLGVKFHSNMLILNYLNILILNEYEQAMISGVRAKRSGGPEELERTADA